MNEPGTVNCGAGMAAPQLGDREVEVVVAWLVHGTKALAAPELHVAECTVKTTIQRIRDKYAAVGRAAPTQVLLLIRLVQDGYLDMDVFTRLESVSSREHGRRVTAHASFVRGAWGA